MKVARRSILLVAAGLCCLASAVSAEPMGTAFTYQGQLKQNGVPVPGPTCDFEFSLWDDPVSTSLSNRLGTDLQLSVEVRNGLFTVVLDFRNVFDGEARWLEIAVRCPAGSGFYTTFDDRQELTPGPYALFATKGGGGGFWSESGNDIYNNNSGNVGIGTLPSSPLDVSGSISTGSVATVTNDIASGISGSALTVISSGRRSITNSGMIVNNLVTKVGGSNSTKTGLEVNSTGSWAPGTSNQPNVGLHVTASGADQNFPAIFEGGNVGIGTTSPSSKLHVEGDTSGSVITTIHNKNNAGTERLYFGTSSGSDAGISVWGSANASTPGKWRFFNNKTSANYDWVINGGIKMTLANNGRLGIGADIPAEKLDVNGNVKVHGKTIYTAGTGPLITAGHNNAPGFEKRMWIGHSEASPTWGIQYRDIASDGLPADSIEFVRGDTTKPRFSFHLATGLMSLLDPSGQTTVWINPNAGGGGAGVLLSNSAGRNTIELDADESDDGVMRLFDAAGNTAIRLHSDSFQSAGEISLFALDSGGILRETVEIIASEGSTSGRSNNGGQITLRNSTGATTIVLDAEHGNGGASRIITDVLQITGADLAERFPVSETADPGMVMEIDRDHPGQLRVARGAYNRRVAGVVSGANGLSVGVVLGHLPGQEDAPPIAMSGRVWVHCDASNGSIEPGDLLTTSSTPGHAMKVTDYSKAQGAVLGKAMTSLEDGRGLVLLLVTLQ